MKLMLSLLSVKLRFGGNLASLSCHPSWSCRLALRRKKSLKRCHTLHLSVDSFSTLFVLSRSLHTTSYSATGSRPSLLIRACRTELMKSRPPPPPPRAPPRPPAFFANISWYFAGDPNVSTLRRRFESAMTAFTCNERIMK